MLMKILNTATAYISLITLCAIILLAWDHTHFQGLDAEKSGDAPITQRFLNRLYFVSTTLSTAGYGDIYPISNSARVTTIIIQTLAAIGLVTMLATK